MSIVDSATDLDPALEKAFRFDREVMVEQYVDGREITVGVLGNDDLVALPLVEVIPDSAHRFFDYDAKYTAGVTREVCPADFPASVTAKAQQMGIAAHRALHLRGYSRTDMIVAENGIYILETNTIPGMTPTSLLPQAATAYGLPFAALIGRLIDMALEGR
jgi:D-alanine-D-alanine ligase